MATPEVHRSGHTPVSPDHAAEVAGMTPAAPSGPPGGSIPPENSPGHHPEVEQDKPRRRPPSGRRQPSRSSRQGAGSRTGRATGKGAGSGTGRATGKGAGSETEETATDRTRTFEFAFEPRLRPLSLLAGVTPGSAAVVLDERHITVRFGRWTLRTPLANVASTQITGPYTWWKVAGPAHLSLADGGITFATTTAGGVCIAFHEPVPALVPGSAIRHPAATVTVSDPQALAAALEEAQLRLLASTGAS